jgi:hypothetical protein
MKIMNKRTFSSSLNDKDNLITLSIVYNNVEIEKVSILRDNKGKTGIYR